MPTLLKRLVDRVQAGLSWRLAAGRRWYRQAVVGPIAARHGLLARRLLWPVPWQAPYQARRLALARPGALGDVLLCTPALRALKHINPRCHVSFYTRYPQVLRGLPWVDAVDDFDRRPADAILLEYEHALPPRRHLAQILADSLGLKVSDVRPSCAVNRDLVENFRRQWRDMPRPYIVVHRRAGPWTPNKDWPAPFWDELIDRLLQANCSVIAIGQREEGEAPAEPGQRLPGWLGRGLVLPASGAYLDLREKTSLEDLIAVLAAADLHVGPVSGPVHIAAAVGTPAVVIYGGYEQPVCSAYRGNINLVGSVACSPCWLRAPCPFGKPCLQQIIPAVVEKAVVRIWHQTGLGEQGKRATPVRRCERDNLVP